jgi:ubiquinone/menaquinone biosynthesis C-methylase UbiE
LDPLLLLRTPSRLSLASQSLDMVYAAHVLHHVAAPVDLLRRVQRCLRPGGALFLVETLENHPLLRLGRGLHPRWRGMPSARDCALSSCWPWCETRAFA